MKKNLIKKLAEDVVKGYFDNGNIIELLEDANIKLKKAGSKNENSRE
ncbi:hypothetical protein [Clostridium ihumii]|nr:hypothetical protein [Clostridium ihumii]